MLVAFPEHYRLYEHVKRAEDDSKGAKTVKNHAGGGNERQDAYLYGHPLGRKKRFRSPADFYPHLVWLATDEDGDPDNCSCKICCPEEVEEKSLPAVKKEVKQEAKPVVKQEATQKLPTNGLQRQSSQSEVKTVDRPSQAVQSNLPQRTAQPAVTIRNDDQRLDMKYGSFVFRQGELVWFNRGSRWGLGVITRRWFQNQQPPSLPAYGVQPLSHPYSHPQAVTITTEFMLRPWLAWSVPSFTHAALNSQPPTFETADWQGIYNKKYGEGDMEVDGSILAAKAIDLSYTPFDTISTTPSSTGTTTLYTGIYLGAERIWLGDPLRLRTGTGLDILILHSITETSQTSAFNNAVLSRSLTLQGDIYTLRQTPSTTPSQPLPTNFDPALPIRIAEDLKRRNASTIPKRNFLSSYVLSRSSATVETRDVKGRWYEASLLAPIVSGQAAWDAELQRGDVGEMGPKMNSRLDCNRAQNAGVQSVVEVRREKRTDAFGGAVPGGLVVEGQGQGQGQRAGQVGGFQGGQGQVQGQGQAQGGAQSQAGYLQGFGQDYAQGQGDGLDEFMNLDA